VMRRSRIDRLRSEEQRNEVQEHVAAVA
jgi:hypothetical protein